jgi:diguanylate cyclase (GGDEF)-like protein
MAEGRASVPAGEDSQELHRPGGLFAPAAEFMAHRSKPFIVLTSTLAVIGLAVVDYLTGPELRFFIFYWPPIAGATWYLGRRWGFAFVGLCGLAWLLANPVGHAENARLGLVAWNTAVNVASFALLAVVVDRIRSLLEHERLTARIDRLTGVANLRSFSESIANEVKRNARSGTPLSLAYMDIDNFKLVNDRLGHAAGDEVLCAVANVLGKNVRAGDLVARLGGDEFALLLPATGEEEAAQVVDRLQQALAALVARATWPISFSTGLVTCSAATCSADDLIHAADTLMYEVKVGGKNATRHRRW